MIFWVVNSRYFGGKKYEEKFGENVFSSQQSGKFTTKIWQKLIFSGWIEPHNVDQ